MLGSLIADMLQNTLASHPPVHLPRPEISIELAIPLIKGSSEVAQAINNWSGHLCSGRLKGGGVVGKHL